MKNKKVVLLYVRRHAGEVDWILPLLIKFKKTKRIITIFSDKSCYESLKKNKDIFKIWKSLSKDYHVISYKNQIFWKLISKILNILPLNYLRRKKFFLNFQNFILRKTFNLKNFLKIFNIEISDIKILFQPIIDKSYFSKLFKFYNSKILVVRFPEATMITANKKENPYLNISKFEKVNGDIFLFSTKNNKEFFLGKSSKFDKRVIYCGFPRYEKWWINKFISNRKILNDTNMFKILVALRGPNKLYFQVSSYNETIKSIMEITKRLKNCKVIFKVHPQEKNNSNLLTILSSYNKKLWSISSEHMIKLSSKANFCISILTSACFDSLSTKTPTVEYYNVKKEISLSDQAIYSYHMVFIKNKKKWLTIFNYKKLLKTIENETELENIILEIYKRKNNHTWKKNFKEFNKLVRNQINTKDIFNRIMRAQTLLK